MEKAYALIPKNKIFANEYIAEYLNKKIPRFSQGSAQKNAYFPNYSDNYLYIPNNHEELSKIIKKIND